jgi:hypothetical protein
MLASALQGTLISVLYTGNGRRFEMRRLILLAIFATAPIVWAQEDPPPEDEGETQAETETVEGLSEEELQDLGIDSQENHTEEDEDVFKPTDNVTYQQSVDFPVDI